MRITTIIKLILISSILLVIGYIGLTSYDVALSVPQIKIALDIKPYLLEVNQILNTINFDKIYLLAAIAPVLIIFTWIVRNSHTWSIYRKFKSLDSNTLDSDTRTRFEFYDMAFRYRCKFGPVKYQNKIQQHFRFFYESHNNSLKWINDIVSQTKPGTLTNNFIISTVCSGRIGRVFSNIHYGRGLTGLNLKPGTPLIAHAQADAVEFWSNSSSKPICTLSKKNLALHRTSQQKNHITGVLLGEKTTSKKPVKIELHFPSRHYSSSKRKELRHEKYGKQHYKQFKTWLEDITLHREPQQFTSFGMSTDHGIDVGYGIPAAELTDDYKAGLTPLARKLKTLEGLKIDAFFDKSALPIAGKDIALDAVALCSGLGIVTITACKATGSICYSGDRKWLVFGDNSSRAIQNGCLQAQQAKISLGNLLSNKDLVNWPITSLVVFTEDGAELNLGIGKQKLQCDVIKLDKIAHWFSTNSKNRDIRFTKNDYNRFALLLNKKQGEYNASIKTEA